MVGVLREFLHWESGVLVPTFNDPMDRTALGILSDCFPDRSVVGVHAQELIVGSGAIPCITQQVIK